MDWKRKCLRNFKLYAITDLTQQDPEILEKINAALRGGVDVIQLRSTALSDRVLFELGRKIRDVTRRQKKLFIVNDRTDLMLAVDADGVHLGQDDLPIKQARRIIGHSKKIIGRSTHSLEQAVEAEGDGADYIGFGPLFRTPTKPTYTPVGLRMIPQVLRRVSIPVVFIGGIDSSNVQSVLQAGANRVAVVRAIFSAQNPYRAAKRLRSKIP
ncbi:MAG: thiamine-phosphate diphosphorylase [Omnitrophica bacterium RIFCSPLOWO2_12_FULL_50_11]|nr:MAG: thiamine-phosphate diphosphorylase [Omnitrophica bacterium RIFCSPLOWO2_12_FULL_50_11]